MRDVAGVLTVSRANEMQGPHPPGLDEPEPGLGQAPAQ